MSHRSMPRRSYRSPYRWYGGIAAMLAVALVLGLAVALGLHWFIAWLLGWGVITFALYGYDKRQARARGGRVPERVLHALALAGGFAGGWIGRAAFHHKTRRRSFTYVLALATVLWATMAWWMFGR